MLTHPSKEQQYLGVESMSASGNLFTPIVGAVGIGGIGGFLVGYTLKKLAKIVVFFLGLGFILLQYMAYRGIITINYAALLDWASNITAPAGALSGFLTQLLVHLPFGASFLLGFYGGFKKG